MDTWGGGGGGEAITGNGFWCTSQPPKCNPSLTHPHRTDKPANDWVKRRRSNRGIDGAGACVVWMCVCSCCVTTHTHTHTQEHTCSTSDMENRPSHAQLTSNTLYTPQTIHLPGIAISGALKEALCQHFAKYLKKNKTKKNSPASTNTVSP